MAGRIQHKRSSVAANVPSAGSLEIGELAINFADRYIYTKNGASAVIRLTGAVPLVQPVANQIAGDSYIDPATGKLYSYFDLNGAGIAWNEIAPPEDLSPFVKRDGSVVMTGPLELNGAAATGSQAIGFSQVVSLIADVSNNFVAKDGSVVMTGLLTLSGAPTVDLHAATKKYVDDAVAIATPDLSAYLPKVGGVMTGQITLPGGGTGNQAATANEVASSIVTHVGLSDPHTQYAFPVEAQIGSAQHATVVGGTADAITATFSPAYAIYTTKMYFRFTAGGANTITNPTINVDGLGVKTIKKLSGSALSIGDIGGAGHVCECVYNGTDVMLLNPALTPLDRTHEFTALQKFSGPVVNNTTTLTDATTIAWSLATGGPDYKVTLGGNRTLGAFTGGTAGQEGMLRVIQDATGGRSLSLSNAVYDFPGGFVHPIARGANDETFYHYKVITANTAMQLRRIGATSIGVGGRDLLNASIMSSSAEAVFVLTNWLALYDRFEVDFDDVLASNDGVVLQFRTSADGGATYDQGASDYAYRADRVRVNVGDSAGNSATGRIPLIDSTSNMGLSNVAGEVASGRVVVYKPSATAVCRISWQTVHVPEEITGAIVRVDGVGIRNALAAVNAVRIAPSAGTFVSGTFRLYGVRV